MRPSSASTPRPRTRSSRSRPTARRAARSSATRPAPGERPGHAAQLLPLAGALLDRAGLRFGDLEPHRRRRRPGHVHRPADRGRHRPRARPGQRGGGRRGLDAARRWPQAPGTTGRCSPCSTRAAARRSPPATRDGDELLAPGRRPRPRRWPGSSGAPGAARILAGRRGRGGSISGPARAGGRRGPGGRQPVSPRERCRHLPARLEERARRRATRSSRSTCGCPTPSRRGAGARSDDPRPDISRLTYADLPQVIAIERRAFPTPWSLAMFVLELSKPSGICLAAPPRRAHVRLPRSARATTRSGTS